MATSGTPPSTGSDPTLANVMASLQASLTTGRPPGGFSSDSVGEIFERQAEYVEELGLEAIRMARAEHGDVVSKVHVDRADQVIRTAERAQRARLFETFGGILLGAGVGQLGSQVAQGHSATSAGWLVAGMTFVIGAVLFAYAIGVRRR